jgi:hypothetical protein
MVVGMGVVAFMDKFSIVDIVYRFHNIEKQFLKGQIDFRLRDKKQGEKYRLLR